MITAWLRGREKIQAQHRPKTGQFSQRPVTGAEEGRVLHAHARLAGCGLNLRSPSAGNPAPLARRRAVHGSPVRGVAGGRNAGGGTASPLPGPGRGREVLTGPEMLATGACCSPARDRPHPRSTATALAAHYACGTWEPTRKCDHGHSRRTASDRLPWRNTNTQCHRGTESACKSCHLVVSHTQTINARWTTLGVSKETDR